MFKGEIFIRFLYKKYIALSLLILICLAIFLFSSQPGEESAKLSSDFLVRKLGHFSEYAALGFFAFTFFLNIFVRNATNLKYKITFLISFVFSILYAASDEFHQTFVVGRDGNIKDVLIDSSGALLGIVVSSVLHYILFSKNFKK